MPWQGKNPTSYVYRLCLFTGLNLAKIEITPRFTLHQQAYTTLNIIPQLTDRLSICGLFSLYWQSENSNILHFKKSKMARPNIGHRHRNPTGIGI